MRQGTKKYELLFQYRNFRGKKISAVYFVYYLAYLVFA